MAVSVQPAARPDNIRRGVIAMIAGTVAFGLMSVLTKLESAHYPFGELVFVRSAVAMVPLSIIVMPRSTIDLHQMCRYRPAAERCRAEAADGRRDPHAKCGEPCAVIPSVAACASHPGGTGCTHGVPSGQYLRVITQARVPG